MSDAKFTPGPWWFDSREHYTLGGDMVEITTHDAQGMVTDQVASVLLDTDNEEALRRGESDARLIAAAPELLEALTSAMRDDHHWHAKECNGRHGVGDDFPCDCWVSRALAAIAKAEGTKEAA